MSHLPIMHPEKPILRIKIENAEEAHNKSCAAERRGLWLRTEHVMQHMSWNWSGITAY